MKFAFIHQQTAEFAIVTLCRVLGVSRSGYYAWLKRPPSERARANQRLTEAIQAAHARSRRTYGAPRIYRDLKDAGHRCSRNRVARLMRRCGLVVRGRRRFKTTTNAKHAYPVAPNVLDRQFTAQRPNEKWLTDITYIATQEGWLYLAVVLDIYSRMIVGWAMDKTMDHTLVAAAFKMAITRRQPSAALLHHSDRGSQYAAHAYQRLLNAHNITLSMSGAGNCYDNAMMESFFSTLKAEEATDIYASRTDARRRLFDYIEVWYNRQRRHSALGYISPTAFESAYHQAFHLSMKTG